MILVVKGDNLVIIILSIWVNEIVFCCVSDMVCVFFILVNWCIDFFIYFSLLSLVVSFIFRDLGDKWLLFWCDDIKIEGGGWIGVV